MSLIETALKKLQANAVAVPSRPETPARAENSSANKARVQASPKPAVVDHAQARQFKRASVDSEAMERHCVLPRVVDQSALRAYKILRTRLLQKLAANRWSSFALTGTESGQGKTLTAINLAIALSQDPNSYVFLVDLDLQRPALGGYLGLKFELGVGDYLLGEAEFEDIVYDPGIDRLAIVPNARAFEHSSDLLSGPRMLNLQQALESEAPRRIIIYDMPPLLLADDVLTFAPHVDGVLLVVSEGMTERGSLERAKEVLPEMNLIGVVLNRSTERNDSPYY